MLGGVDSISEILSVTKAFGEATGFGAEVGGLIGEAGLSSYPVASGSYTFDASGDIGGGGAVNGRRWRLRRCSIRPSEASSIPIWRS